MDHSQKLIDSRILKSSNGTFVHHVQHPFFPKLSNNCGKNNDKNKSQRCWVTTRKECFMDIASQMHVWTHSGYDRINKQARQNQKWRGKVSIKSYALTEELWAIDWYWERKCQFSLGVLVLLWPPHSSRSLHTQENKGNISCTWYVFKNRVFGD